jgi:hypothetical protein
MTDVPPVRPGIGAGAGAVGELVVGSELPDFELPDYLVPTDCRCRSVRSAR